MVDGGRGGWRWVILRRWASDDAIDVGLERETVVKAKPVLPSPQVDS